MRRVEILISVEADDAVWIGEVNRAVRRALHAAGSVKARGGQVHLKTADVLNKNVAEAARSRSTEKEQQKMSITTVTGPEGSRVVLVPAVRHINGMPVDESTCPPMPDTNEAMLASPEFNAIYDEIKDWDVNVPKHYAGYCGLNGSHVAIILNALTAAGLKVVPVEG